MTNEAPIPCNADRLLVVDDDVTVLSFYKRMVSIAFRELEVDTAANGPDGITAFELHHHAVIIMDVRMPEMSGAEAFSAIKKLCAERNWALPVMVAMTACWSI